MVKYNKYRVLWTVTHTRGGVQRTQISPIILARNLAECLKKAVIKKSNELFLDCYVQPWYKIEPATIYEMGSQIAFCYSDGFWRRFWTHPITENTFN